MLAQTTVNSLQLLVKNPIGTISTYSYEFISSVPEASTLIIGVLLLLPLGWSAGQALCKSRPAPSLQTHY